jgi:hypothetical protein
MFQSASLYLFSLLLSFIMNGHLLDLLYLPTSFALLRHHFSPPILPPRLTSASPFVNISPIQLPPAPTTPVYLIQYSATRHKYLQYYLPTENPSIKHIQLFTYLLYLSFCAHILRPPYPQSSLSAPCFHPTREPVNNK